MKTQADFLKEISLEELSEPQREICEIIGLDNYIALSQHFGGTQVYIATIDQLHRIYVKRRIKREYKLFKAPELSRRYGVSETFVYHAIREAKQEE